MISRSKIKTNYFVQVMEGAEISNKINFPKELFFVGEKYSKKDIDFKKILNHQE